MRRRKWLTREQLAQEILWRSKISEAAVLDAQQKCGNVLLAELADTVIQQQVVPRTRPVDSWAAKHDVLYGLLPVLEKNHVIERTGTGFNWTCRQSLFLWLLCTADRDFNDWSGAVRFFTIQGKTKTSVQLRNAFQRLSYDPPLGWYEIEALFPEKSE